MSYLTYILLLTLLVLSSLADDTDLADFEFEDESKSSTAAIERRSDLKVIDDDDFHENQQSSVNAFVAKQQQIQGALQRATKNKKYTQIFAQILPIMRSLNKHQKIVLAALITAQSGAPPGKEINFKQVSKFLSKQSMVMRLNTFSEI